MNVPVPLPDLDALRAECRAMVRRRAALSASVAVVPLPGVDVATDLTLLMELIPAITLRFGLTPQQIDGLPLEKQALVYGVVKKAGSLLIGRVVTQELLLTVLKKVGVRLTVKQVARFVPVLGQAAAAGLSYGAMVYLGHTHIEHCYRVARALREGHD
ncbi:hypothetical protein [Crenobacter luteus]|uniref:DUF697 domain-containing protein n=1 Tax=Crenobacter luteus TaxID=1452487 RepID=A0A161SFW8_9NEIS|nr:hypothetical protein [Crenobacter luteus]KZE31780.1 hypothetical protein AVW16_00925 [Crenobacter luteus]